MMHYPIVLTEEEEKVVVPNGKTNTGIKGIVFDRYNRSFEVRVNVNMNIEKVAHIPCVEAIKVYKRLYYKLSNRPSLVREPIILTQEEAIAEIIKKYIVNQEQGIKQIELTKDKVAIVDAKNYDWLTKLGSWCYKQNDNAYTGYAYKKYKNERVFMHLVIARKMGIKSKADHKNRNGIDNREENLREASHSENMRNRKLPENNTSGIAGVHFDTEKNKWRAIISINKDKIHLGYFENKNDAIEARIKGELKYYGDFNPE